MGYESEQINQEIKEDRARDGDPPRASAEGFIQSDVELFYADCGVKGSNRGNEMNDVTDGFITGLIVGGSLMFIVLNFYLKYADDSWRQQIVDHGCAGYYLDVNSVRQWDWKRKRLPEPCSLPTLDSGSLRITT
jgi:hypothetical protein